MTFPLHSVLLIDHHDIVRFALQTLISACPVLRPVESAASLGEGLRLIGELKPDLVISDIALPDSTGLSTVRAVIEAQGPRRTLVFSMQDEALYGPQVMALGADGFVPKEAAHATVLEAALKVLAGDIWISPSLTSTLVSRSLSRRSRAPLPARAADRAASLTTRELEVLEHLRAGKSTKQIASALDLSVRTVDLHRSNLKSKLGFRTGAELIVFAAQNP